MKPQNDFLQVFRTDLHLSDPLPVPVGMDEADYPDDPTEPISPTTLAASSRAGQRHVDAISRSEVLQQELARYGKDPGYVSGLQAVSEPEHPFSGAARFMDDYDNKTPQSERPRTLSGNGAQRKPRLWTDVQREQHREAMGSAGILALAVACAIIMAACAFAFHGAAEWFHTMGSHIAK